MTPVLGSFKRLDVLPCSHCVPSTIIHHTIISSYDHTITPSFIVSLINGSSIRQDIPPCYYLVPSYDNIITIIPTIIDIYTMILMGQLRHIFYLRFFPSELPSLKIFSSFASTSWSCLNLKFDSPLHDSVGSQTKL